MDDIQIDDAGNLRCSHCGGRNFSEKRTRRSKVIGVSAGVATVGIAGAAAPLVAKKKLYCQACGTYNKMGNAQPYSPKASKAAAPVKKQSPTTPSKTNEVAGLILFAVLFGIGCIWAFSTGHWIFGTIAALLAVFSVCALFVDTDTAPPKPPTRSTGTETAQFSDPGAGGRLEMKKPHRRVSDIQSDDIRSNESDD
ncbi:hypothetical protein [Gordonia sp. NB41Y]|uniref:hypothetical protein n=1 Tax=Gordonia sp. NB41Y TaxID=875808 RepID=UPI0006B1889A|nr:hypothetical protein [Gordonia sp. NB41Y]KOY49463.1 hypothetical protein ISGA_09985 [Gordonia sp. NB41Y]WLP90260.1 hypothetical protein Q9K23_22545 [Gordonia sp. NB41Y]